MFFACWQDRREGKRYRHAHRKIELTGRKRPHKRNRHSIMTARSCHTAREYKCECGYVGWSNHIDLAYMELGSGVSHEELRA